MAVQISQIQFGWHQSKLDIKDWRLGDYMPRAYDTSGAREWNFPVAPLNQGQTNHCCGFGLADWGINEPIVDAYTDSDANNFYYMMKEEDGEPGNENGSTCRTVAKVGQKLGRMTNYAFASSIDEMVYWILNHGPVIIGIPWTYDMMTPDANNTIHPTGDIAGGHCCVINAKYEDSMARLRNSWGIWGINGEAMIALDDLAKLFRNGGEIIAAIEEPLVSNPPVQNDGCWTAIAKLFGSK